MLSPSTAFKPRDNVNTVDNERCTDEKVLPLHANSGHKRSARTDENIKAVVDGITRAQVELEASETRKEVVSHDQIF